MPRISQSPPDAVEITSSETLGCTPYSSGIGTGLATTWMRRVPRALHAHLDHVAHLGQYLGTEKISRHALHGKQDHIALTRKKRSATPDNRHTLFVHDWRAVPVQAWLERMNHLFVGGSPDGPSAARADLAVLSQAEFAEEVRKALRQLSRPDVLAASPLTRTRLIAERAGQDPAAALGDLLRQAIDDLREDPRSVKFHRALCATFLRGTPTQELAAEQLRLPFTTYRRHLTRGIEHVYAVLWRRELYGTAATEYPST
jgi:hypothetical protein